MRLQLLIQRNSLPPVTIIHTTASGPASHTKSRSATIADLLADVNDIVPLESADGEWGLEDYVVEVAATADQHLTYECLHYQTLHSVLREDDEVVIRALSSEDLRARRLGGRHQITGDGRHLIDGVAFGRQWLRKTDRPGIIIPPRKRRRILLGEDTEDANEEDPRRILPATNEEEDNYMNALVPFADQDEEDDDDDDDYVDEGDADMDEPPLQVTIREDFDDADADSEDEDELNVGEADEQLSSELKHLLEDAAEIEQAANMAIALRVIDRKLKRKRETGDDGEEHENETFEGFSSPVHRSPAKAYELHGIPEDSRAELGDDGDESSDSMMKGIADRHAKRRTRNIVDDDSDDSDDSDVISGSDVTSSDSDADSMMEEIAMEQAKKRVLNLIRDDDADGTSSFDPERNESDDDISSASDSESTSVGGSSSESETSSDSESDIEETKAEKSRAARPIGALQTSPSPGQQGMSSVGVPFQGTNKTHYNNQRVKRRKRLNELKTQGLLPENAGFEELAKYETTQQQKMSTEQSMVVEKRAESPAQGDMQNVKSGEEALATPAVNGIEKEHVKPSNDVGSTAISDAPVEPRSTELKPPGTSQIEPAMAVELAPKRARLDVASTRRLVFGSLGLRAPKNAEEGQALREKLSRNRRQPILQKGLGDSSALEAPEGPSAAKNDDDSWKNKLTVAAFECEEPGVFLPPPPFPFEQGWARPGKNKRKLRDQSQYYQSRNGLSRERASAPDVVTLNYDDVSAHVSGNQAVPTLDGNSDDLPAQGHLDGLPELEQAMILPGATVAYKELHVDASTNYQPEVSQYRVGQVSQVDEDGTIHLRLTKSSMTADSKGKIDPQTGQRVYGKFELAGEDPDEGADDGLREVSISDMISAKLVKPSVIEVPDSDHVNGPKGGEVPTLSSNDEFAAIPESAAQDIQVNAAEKPSAAAQRIETPRKQEINGRIKEAGFNSALDEELLQPICDPTAGDAQVAIDVDEAMTQSQEQYPHRFRPRSPGVDLSLSGVKISSDVDTNADHAEGVGGGGGTTGSFEFPSPSSPYMPTLETVDYPHLSQIAIDSSDPTCPTNSTAHQDAQKHSLTPALDLSSIASASKRASNTDSYGKKGELDAEHFEDENPSRSEDVPESPKSEVPESQSQKASMPSQTTEADDEESADRSSFLGGLGYDGQDASYPDTRASGDDGDPPSPSELLLPGQRNRRRTRSLSKKVPFPPSRKSPRNAAKKTRKSQGPSSSPDPSVLSQTDIKQSQSQRKPRLSEIPTPSPVVDLTFSDDDDSDPTDGPKQKKSELKALGRSTSARGGKQDSGIGRKRLLTTKKAREYY